MQAQTFGDKLITIPVLLTPVALGSSVDVSGPFDQLSADLIVPFYVHSFNI
jgi:hypothetical protein